MLPVIGKKYRIRLSGENMYMGTSALKPKEQAVSFVFHRISSSENKFMCVAQGGGQDTWYHAGKIVIAVPGGDQENVQAYTPKEMAEYPEGLGYFGREWTLIVDGDGIRLWNLKFARYARNSLDYGVYLSDTKDAKSLWVLEECGEYPTVTGLSRITPPTLKTPELKDLNEPPTYTPDPPVLSGQVAVPWFLVEDDHKKSEAWRGENSPYYIIKRWSSWHKKQWKVLAKGISHSHSVTETEGVTESKSTEIDKTLNMSNSAEAGFSFKGASASMSQTVGESLSVKTTTTWQHSYSKSYTDSKTVGPYSSDTAIADWFRHDIYRVYRIDGKEEILEFEVVRPGSHAQRSYPPKGDLTSGPNPAALDSPANAE